jgi:hypothetical protein
MLIARAPFVTIPEDDYALEILWVKPKLRDNHVENTVHVD